MCVRYDGTNLSIMSHKQGIIEKDKKYAKSEWFSIPCTFKYRKEEYLKALQNNETIAYQVIDKGKYFIICSTFEYISSNYLIDFIFSLTRGLLFTLQNSKHLIAIFSNSLVACSDVRLSKLK